MNNQQVRRDVKALGRRTLWVAISVHLFLLVLIPFVGHFFPPLQKPLIGVVSGAFVATINLFAIGYAAHGVLVLSQSRAIVIWPIITFLLMCVMAYVFAIQPTNLSIGFAFGLSVPIVLAVLVLFVCPLDP